MALSKPAMILYDQYLEIKNCTFGEKARKRMDKSKKEQQREEILQSVCALLNSGGGVITAGSDNKDFNYDTMGLGDDIEEHLTQLVEPSVIEDFIEFKQCGNTLQIHVKSWCPNGQRARICSVDSGLRKRSGASTHYINCNGVIEFLKNKNRDTISKPPTKRPKVTQKAQDFYEKGEAFLDQILDFSESVNVEFKSFERESNLEKRLKENIPKYLSSFANTKGGYLFIGVQDKTNKVVGCGQGLDPLKIEQIVHEICGRAKARAVHLLDCAKTLDCRVDSKVFEVKNNSNGESRYIIALHVQAFCCAVFEDDPKCWHIEDGTIKRLNPSKWLEKMQLSRPDDELIEHFKKVLSLKDSPPQCRPVYSTQTITKLQERIFSVQSEDFKIMCESIPPELFVEYHNLLNPPFRPDSGPGILIMSTSWAVDINVPRNKDVICEALMITSGSYPMLFSWVKKGSPELWQYVCRTALNLKQKLVNLGGYRGRLCVIPYLLNCHTGELIKDETDAAYSYPESYTLCGAKEVETLLQSLAIVLLSFTSPLSNTLGFEFFNLLTEQQFKILHGYSDIKHLFIHGPPGSGKTLIAMEKIQRIKNSDGCENNEILYLCENVGLRDFVRSRSICLCETRASFMMKGVKNFDSIKHIIVDEGQNFRMKNGDWYKRAEDLMQRKPGTFWIFVDYFQRSHTDKDGLPSLTDQDTVCLFEVVRNSKVVFNKMSELMSQIANNSESDEAKHLKKINDNRKLSHSFNGELVIKKAQSSVENSVVEIVKTLLKGGHSAGDIAVLYSTLEELNERGYIVKNKGILFCSVDEIYTTKKGEVVMEKGKVVLDTFRRFSGLERNIVIVVNPDVHPFQSKIQSNVLLSAISRARIRLFLLYSNERSCRHSCTLKLGITE